MQVISENKKRIITITSKWYFEFTLNMLTSLKKLDLHKNIVTYCLDDDSFNAISGNEFKAKQIETSYEITKNPTHYGTKEFNTFMYYKMKVIKDELSKNDFLLYTDGDVVFKKDFKNIFDDQNSYEMVAIKDFNVINPEKESICAGFMLLKSNLNIRRLFNPNLIVKNNFKIQDQEIINSKKKRIKYKFLDKDEFCNGSYYLKNYEQLDPVAIHFNYILGDTKKETMKKLNCWYV